MKYEKHERIEVIRQAYKGLFQLASRGLFDKYVDFIDVYSEISDQEEQQLYETIIQHKETAMLAQYIKEKGRQEGRQAGRQEGRQEEKRENLLSFVRRSHEQGVSVSTIAKIVQLDISIVNNILKNEYVDIPLHLLNSSGIS